MDIQAETTPSAPGPSTFRAFGHRNFGLFFFGQTISMIGTWSQVLAVSWLVWQLTGSSVWLGVVGFALQFPTLLLGLPGGVAADRYDRLITLNLMQVLCMTQAVVLGVLTLTGRVELWHVIALSCALGIIYSFEFPTRQSFIMDMVGKSDLLNAVSINAAMFHATRIIGPVAAGAIVAWKGEGVCFLFNAATFLFLIVSLSLIDRAKLTKPVLNSAPLIKSIHEGFKYMWNMPEAKFALLLVAILSGFGMQFTTLMPVFVDHIYGGGASQLGWLMGAGGVGACSGSIYLARRHSTEKLFSLSSTTAATFAGLLMAFSVVSGIWFAIPLLAAAGFFLTISFSCISTLLQHSTPDHLRGRIMSFFTITFMGFGPFGSLLAGFSAREFGAPATLFACGALCFITAIAVRMRRS